MSPFILLAFLLSSVAVAGLVLLTIRYVRPKALRWLLCGVSVALFGPLLGGMLWAMDCMATTYHGDVSPEAVPIVHLPATAAEVSYVYSPGRSIVLLAEFSMAEPDFPAWLESRGWTPEPLVRPESMVRTSSYRERWSTNIESVLVADGLRFDDYDKDRFDDSGTTVLYDRSTGTVFLQITAF